MKSILDLAYGVLAGRPESPRPSKAKGGIAGDGARKRNGKAATAKPAKASRGAAPKRKRGRAASRSRAR